MFLRIGIGLFLLVAAHQANAAPLGGPKGEVNFVGAYSEVIYTETCFGGEDTVVMVTGDGDTDLDVYVYDVWGNLIASDSDSTDFCQVTFIPYQNGAVRNPCGQFGCRTQSLPHNGPLENRERALPNSRARLALIV
jgi:hypothetical protein